MPGNEGRVIGRERDKPEKLEGDVTGAHPAGFDAATGERRITPAIHPVHLVEDENPVGECKLCP